MYNYLIGCTRSDRTTQGGIGGSWYARIQSDPIIFVQTSDGKALFVQGPKCVFRDNSGQMDTEQGGPFHVLKPRYESEQELEWHYLGVSKEPTMEQYVQRLRDLADNSLDISELGDDDDNNSTANNTALIATPTQQARDKERTRAYAVLEILSKISTKDTAQYAGGSSQLLKHLRSLLVSQKCLPSIHAKCGPLGWCCFPELDEAFPDTRTDIAVCFASDTPKLMANKSLEVPASVKHRVVAFPAGPSSPTNNKSASSAVPPSKTAAAIKALYERLGLRPLESQLTDRVKDDEFGRTGQLFPAASTVGGLCLFRVMQLLCADSDDIARCQQTSRGFFYQIVDHIYLETLLAGANLPFIHSRDP